MLRGFAVGASAFASTPGALHSERTVRRASRADAETGRAVKPRGRSSDGSIRRGVRQDAPETREAVPPSRRNESCRCRSAAQIEHASTLSGRSPEQCPPAESLRLSPGRKADPGRCDHGRAAARARSRAGAEPPSSPARRPRPRRSKSARPAAGDHRDAVVVKRGPECAVPMGDGLSSSGMTQCVRKPPHGYVHDVVAESPQRGSHQVLPRKHALSPLLASRPSEGTRGGSQQARG